MDNELFKMQDEVEKYANKIEELCRNDEELNMLYLGCQIYYSPIYDKSPELMFIGINPGSGAFNKGRKILTKPRTKVEYETEEFTLQKEWKYVFGEKEKINNLDLLYNSFKTNTCFFATKNETDLIKLKSILKYKYHLDLFQKEKEWIPLLVQKVYPRIIICEGFGAYENLKKIYTNEEIKNEWSNNPNSKIAYLSYTQNDFSTILAFKRIYSNYLDIENVIDTIYETLK